MNLKTLPISFTGNLHHVKLISLSVDAEEVLENLPTGIEPHISDGRVHFSLVSVELKSMKANVFPVPFGYHHVALRLRINDAQYNRSGQNQGIFFYKSFTNNPIMISGGKLLTNYNLEKATFTSTELEMEAESESGFLKFGIDTENSASSDPKLFDDIQQLDRAYFTTENKLYRTVITRKEWPIKWAECFAFETNLFESVRVDGAFYIDHTIPYKWNKPAFVTQI